jgi:Zn-finger nucleic acid-binding protein
MLRIVRPRRERGSAGDVCMCPKCNEPMLIVEFQGVEVDHCLDCRGTWFDAGELELVVEMADGDPERLHTMLGAEGARASEKRRCPRCRRQLRVLRIGTPPIEIDVCPRRRGDLAGRGRAGGGGAGSLLREQDESPLAEFFGDLFRHELTGQDGGLTDHGSPIR